MTHVAEAVQRSQAIEILDAVNRDATFFPRRILGWSPWAKQRALLESVRDHRYTMFISGHGIGKTRALASIICEAMVMRPEAKIVCSATTYTQVHDTLWGEVKKLHGRARLPLGGDLRDAWWTLGESRANIIAVDDPTAIQGIHGPYVLVVLDEAEGIKQEMWDAYNSLMSSHGSRMVVCFNPVTPSGYLYDEAKNHGQWNVIHASCLEHPNVTSGENQIPGAVTREWVNEMRVKEGEDSPAWFARVLGRFPEQSVNSLVSLRDLEESESWPAIVDEPRRIGVDLSRGNGDYNVMTVLDETRTVIAVEEWRDQDSMPSVGRVIDAMTRYNVQAHNVSLDTCGLGGPIADRMREIGHDVAMCNFGTAPVGDWHHVLGPTETFPNRRCELHGVFRRLVKQREIRIPAKFKKTIADLSAVQFYYDSRGRFAVESKDELKRRIRRSPDHGDSLLLALNGAGCMGGVTI